MAPLKAGESVRCARASGHFHGSTAVAPLKPSRACPGRRGACRFPRLNSRGPIEAAWSVLGVGNSGSHFHGSTAVAPLKQSRRRNHSPTPLGFPRLNSRGPIEAMPCPRRPVPLASVFPRLNSRGPIEAQSAPGRESYRSRLFPRLNSRGPIEAACPADSPTAAIRHFHGSTAVAPLKR